jgi:short-subunit dehydrogenase
VNVDVLVNNAGYGLTGALESLSMEQIRRQYETNVFGLMAVTQAVLPYRNPKILDISNTTDVVYRQLNFYLSENHLL